MPLSPTPNGPRKFRAACDPCHIRKIRCQISPASTVCEGCASNDRACFFTLCRRAGRPRSSLTASAVEASVRYSQSVSTTSSVAQPRTVASPVSMAPPDVQDLSRSGAGLSTDWLSLAESASFESRCLLQQDCPESKKT